MTSPPVLPESTELIDASGDPGAFVVAAVGRAKRWLEQATTTDLPAVVDAKARAEAIRCYVLQKELGRDAELAAAEIVRRAERRIGELIREGQDRGEIRRVGEGSRDHDQPSAVNRRLSPSSFASSTELSGNGVGIYAMTDDVSSDEFEEALEGAKVERNLSRRNLVGKIREVKERRPKDQSREPRTIRAEQIADLAARGQSSAQIAEVIGVRADHVRRVASQEGIPLPADEAIGRTRRIDSNRIVRETVETLANHASLLDLVEVTELEPASVEEWVTSLKQSLRTFQRFTKELSG
jgi:hypothetical protein